MGCRERSVLVIAGAAARSLGTSGRIVKLVLLYPLSAIEKMNRQNHEISDFSIIDAGYYFLESLE